ncbi:DUF2514 family protein [Pusillimonas sp. NJUB218]|uniref:DUF2514 family protein n=1 Tax=Pusillimonas sp. NJUB218 TaxID=2023230 RepID=UPI000F4BAA4C|nr:DUF2514 family protein [Pusillimonas sp. NJUB218]ROT44988.1 hypothetical protein CHR62_09045 [Pusillimonas sp. NJUB218]
MIRVLLGWKGYAAAAIVAGVAAWWVQGWRYDAQISRIETAQATAMADAQAKARQIEQARVAAIEEVTKDADEKIAAVQADADAAADSAKRLRAELARLRRAASDTAATGSGPGQPGADPIGVLAVVLGELDDRAGEVGRYADRLKVAGLACEMAYDSLRSGQ